MNYDKFSIVFVFHFNYILKYIIYKNMCNYTGNKYDFDLLEIERDKNIL